MTGEPSKTVTYRKVPTSLPEGRLSSAYDVLLDGHVMGRVVRRRETLHYRSGPRQVRHSSGTHWRYQEAVVRPARNPEGTDSTEWHDSPSWDPSRDHATLGLLRHVHGMDIDDVRAALGKPAHWC